MDQEASLMAGRSRPICVHWRQKRASVIDISALLY